MTETQTFRGMRSKALSRKEYETRLSGFEATDDCPAYKSRDLRLGKQQQCVTLTLAGATYGMAPSSY